MAIILVMAIVLVVGPGKTRRCLPTRLWPQLEP
jgi:hypothetical protein